MRRLTLLASIVSTLSVAACDAAPVPDAPLSKADAREQAKANKADGGHFFDFCEYFDWYGDGICDDFCAHPDPDCEEPGSDICGGIVGWECEDGEFCKFDDEQACGFADQIGTCTETPEICIEIFAPVCGCDGVTYANDCFADGAGVNVAHVGECDAPSCDDDVPIHPLCDIVPGCEPGTVLARQNGCFACVDPDTCEEPPPPPPEEEHCGGFAGFTCSDPADYCHWDIGEFCGAADHLGTCTPKPEVCLQVFAPVCGCDGNTYSNSCMAAGAGVSVASEGACGQDS